MKAAILYAPNPPLEVEELTLDKPHRSEVLIRNHSSGVCHSDWRVISGDTKHPSSLSAPGNTGNSRYRSDGAIHSSTYRLEEINTAFNDMLSGEAARGVILFD
ncbi:MAG: hypothetical protein IMY85_05440 [Chloroflexi bacterium]|nr:hypothetical protein [Chloroflexota bacterium]